MAKNKPLVYAFSIGDKVITSRPSDTVEAYYDQPATVTKLIHRQPYKMKNGIRYTGEKVPELDGWHNKTGKMVPEYHFVRYKHKTGPKTPSYIVTFDDGTLDQDWLPFRETDLKEA